LLTHPLLVFVVEGVSPRGGDLQLEQGSRGQVAGFAQGTAQGAGDRQARLERRLHQASEGGGARCFLQQRSVVRAGVEWRRAQCRGGLERHIVASPCGGSEFIAAVGTRRAREGRGLKLTIDGSPRLRGPAGNPLSYSARRLRRFRGAEGPTPPSRPAQAAGGAGTLTPPSLRQL
jgi:hypothetical protein